MSRLRIKKKKRRPSAANDPALASMPSPEVMEGIMVRTTGFGDTRLSDADGEAQDIMYDAWDAPNLQRAVALARQALAVSPDCADAYNLLAELTAGSLQEGVEIYRKGVEASQRALGEEAFVEDVEHFWGLLETRPYMRARVGLADCLWRLGKGAEAVEHYQDLLRLNPMDNQGTREALLPRLIELGRDEDAEEVYQFYEEEARAIWPYLRALLDFRKHGDSAIADKSIEEAFDRNEYAPAYLLGERMDRRCWRTQFGFRPLLRRYCALYCATYCAMQGRNMLRPFPVSCAFSHRPSRAWHVSAAGGDHAPQPSVPL